MLIGGIDDSSDENYDELHPEKTGAKVAGDKQVKPRSLYELLMIFLGATNEN
jgi:hypothetical protein